MLGKLTARQHRRLPRVFRAGVVVLGALAACNAVAVDEARVANTYHQYADAELEAVCAAMSPNTYASGLTDGAWAAMPFTGRTYYDQSACYLELARRTGNAAYCQQVRERKTLLGDGSAVSPQSCQRTVAQVLAARQAQQVSAERHATAVKGAFEIVTLAVQDLPQGGWQLTVSTQGALAGDYRFEIERLTPRLRLASQDLSLSAPGSHSWTLTHQDVLGNTPLPAIFPLAISLYYRVPATTTEPARMHLTSIRNLTLSAP